MGCYGDDSLKCQNAPVAAGTLIPSWSSVLVTSDCDTWHDWKNCPWGSKQHVIRPPFMAGPYCGNRKSTINWQLSGKNMYKLVIWHCRVWLAVGISSHSFVSKHRSIPHFFRSVLCFKNLKWIATSLGTRHFWQTQSCLTFLYMNFDLWLHTCRLEYAVEKVTNFIPWFMLKFITRASIIIYYLCLLGGSCCW